MAACYYYRANSVTTGLANVRSLLFPANSSRVTLVITTTAGGIVRVCDADGSSLNNVLVVVTSSGMNVFPYRDFGPSISGEVWVSSSAGGLQIFGLEVFSLPSVI